MDLAGLPQMAALLKADPATGLRGGATSTSL